MSAPRFCPALAEPRCLVSTPFADSGFMDRLFIDSHVMFSDSQIRFIDDQAAIRACNP
jgi:hypothetical protein